MSTADRGSGPATISQSSLAVAAVDVDVAPATAAVTGGALEASVQPKEPVEEPPIQGRATPSTGEAEARASGDDGKEGFGKSDPADLEETWGIRILSIRLTAVDRMIDFRYRVVDPEKALPLFDRNEKPYLLHQKTGLSVGVPRTGKIGPLRNADEPIPDTNFFILFDNPRRFIRRGDEVTVVVGDLEVEGLTVR